MIWDHTITTTLFGYDDSNTEFLSNTYAIEAEYGPLIHATISGSDSSELRMYYSNDAENFTLLSGVTRTSTGILDATGTRAPFWRFGFRNTEASPSSNPLCTAKWGVRKNPQSNIRNLYDRPAEIHAEVTGYFEVGSFPDQSPVGSIVTRPSIEIYGNYRNVNWYWEG